MLASILIIFQLLLHRELKKPRLSLAVDWSNTVRF